MKTFLNFIIFFLFATILNAQNISIDNTAVPSRASGSYDWKVFIRSDEATLNTIDHVEYLLNPTFANPQVSSNNRATNFAYSAKGGGEFEIKARVFFRDTRKKPTIITYWLRLQSKAQRKV